MAASYVSVRVKNHPARVDVYNLHLPECTYARSGDNAATSSDDYAVGRLTTRSQVPPSTGWVFGKGSAGGPADAPVWIGDDALRFTCQSCLRGRSAASLAR
jgi:hypothetical protein